MVSTHCRNGSWLLPNGPCLGAHELSMAVDEVSELNVLTFQ